MFAFDDARRRRERRFSMENGENDRGVVKIGVVLGRLAANRKFDVQNCGGGRPSRFAPKFAGIGGVWAQLIALAAWLTVSASIRARLARF
ncbi:hypothetical protein L596_026411 [Steinernema carpocapsae]|uniref:Uncharacterized protein n=1 Tax=Steinernema carpocapsae TaxID=34508 RepID=A0A4U5M1A4_STECR|nr:hypothetical protein L596_026411 [Steinernema carpocapsae]